MQEAEAGFLPDTCTIYEPPARATATRTSRGDIDDAFPTNWTKTEGVACRVNLPQRRPLIQSGAGQVQVISEGSIDFPSSTVISKLARIKITASTYNPLFVGQFFDATDAPQESTPIIRRVQVKQA